MKLSVETYVLCDRFGDFKAIDLAKEAGFDAVDYSYYWSNDTEEVVGDGYLDHAKKVRAYLDQVGMVCNQAHAPFTLAYGDQLNPSEEKYRRLLHAMESAAILGAKNIIVHAIKVPKDVDLMAYNLAYYRSLIPYCEKFGIHVAVENLFYMDAKRKHLRGTLGSPAEINHILSELNSPWMVACVDLGHASLTGYEPEDFIDGVNPTFLKALHVQDNDYLEDRHVLPFTGNLNWPAIMKSLKNKGYDGELTFEIFAYLSRFPNELIPDALKFAATVGRYMLTLGE